MKLSTSVKAAAVVAASGLVLGTWSGPAASAAASGSSAYQGAIATGSAAKCLPGDAAQGSAAGRTADGVVAHDDSPTAAEVRAYEADFNQRLSSLSDGERKAVANRTKTYKIKVRAHILKPSKKAKPMKRKAVKKQIGALNRAFTGKQSGPSPRSRIRFGLKTVDWTANKSWYAAKAGSVAHHRMMRKLHEGGKGTLNLYFGRPRDDKGNNLLGYANYPQDARGKVDGTFVDSRSVPGGSLRGYGLGDTGVHEVGHWLGLYHTFQGGCSKKNDHVRDTAAHRAANFKCRKANSCKSRGGDPIRNFLNYAPDSCMDRFTKGQVKRMRKMWRVYRH